MDFPDVEPKDPLNAEPPRELGPGDCQRIDLRSPPPDKTIEIPVSKLDLMRKLETLVESVVSESITAVKKNTQGPPEVPSPDLPAPKTKNTAVAIAEKLAEKLGLEGAFYFVVCVSQEITKRLSQDKKLWTETFAGKLEDVTVYAVAKQLGVVEIINAMDDLYLRQTGELFTKTHQINLSLGGVVPALLKQIPLVGSDLAQLSKDLADYLITKIRSKKVK